MVRRLSRDERGFTLMELLVVLLVIGILAAIALPMFLGERDNADDGDAKSNARNMISQVDSCYTTTEDYRNCATQAALGPTGLDWGPGPGEVRVVNPTKTTYEVVAVSRAVTSGANHIFRIASGSDRMMDLSCTAGLADNDGGCHGGEW